MKITIRAVLLVTFIAAVTLAVFESQQIDPTAPPPFNLRRVPGDPGRIAPNVSPTLDQRIERVKRRRAADRDMMVEMMSAPDPPAPIGPAPMPVLSDEQIRRHR